MTALAFAIAVLQSLPALLAAGVELETFVQAQVALIKQMNAAKRDPTPDEWAALEAAVAGDTAALVELGKIAETQMAGEANGQANNQSTQKPAG